MSDEKVNRRFLSSDANSSLVTRHSFLFVPFQDDAMHHSTDLEKFFLMMHHVSPREAADGVIFAQENRLLRTNLFTHSAIDAADHVDIEFLRELFDFGEAVAWRDLTGNNFNRARWTNEFAKLTCYATHPTVRIAD